jgi:MFS family permease
MKSVANYRVPVIASTIGNVMEWFDFISFGYLMGLITKHFFPNQGGAGGLLLASATFGVSFVARPVGAVILGVYADRAGRRAALFLTMMLMTVSAALITLSPTYASIGISATVIMVLARVIQGVSAGGDFGSGTAMLVEYAPRDMKGLFGSFMLFSQAIAGTMAATSGYLITELLSPTELDSWGWRLPFAFGLLIAPIGLYIRRHVAETEEFTAAIKSEKKKTLLEFLQEFPVQILVGTGLSTGITIVQIFFNVYMPVYAVMELHVTAKAAFLAVALSGVVRIVSTPFFGAMSDRGGRRRMMIAGCALNMIAVMPCLLWLTAYPSFQTLLAVEFVISILTQIVNGAIPTALSELFPTVVRAQGLSISYNTAITIFGGTAPLVITWLVARSANELMPGYYLTFGMALSLTCAFLLARDAGVNGAPARVAATDGPKLA